MWAYASLVRWVARHANKQSLTQEWAFLLSASTALNVLLGMSINGSTEAVRAVDCIVQLANAGPIVATPSVPLVTMDIDLMPLSVTMPVYRTPSPLRKKIRTAREALEQL